MMTEPKRSDAWAAVSLPGLSTWSMVSRRHRIKKAGEFRVKEAVGRPGRGLRRVILRHLTLMFASDAVVC